MVALGDRIAGPDGQPRRLDGPGPRGRPTPPASRCGRCRCPSHLRGKLDSEVADLKNITDTRYGGALAAGLFLREFVGDGIPWAHLDIAGPADSSVVDGELVKGGTGFGVRTLVELLSVLHEAEGARALTAGAGQAASGGRSSRGDALGDLAVLDRPGDRLVGDGRVEPPARGAVARWPRCPRRARAATAPGRGLARACSSTGSPGDGGSVHAAWASWSGSGRRAIWIRVSGGSLRRTRSVVSSSCWAAPKRQQRSIERRNGEWRPGPRPEPELGGGEREVELVAVGLVVEAGDQPAQEPGGRRAEQPEPEPLDVGGAHLVAHRVDHRVEPGLHGEAWRSGRQAELRTSKCMSCSFRSVLSSGVKGSLAWRGGGPEDGIEEVRRLLAGARRVVVLTGAGISTDSGIADFRGPQGLWTKDPAAEKAAHISHYLSRPGRPRAGVAQPARRRRPSTAEPNAGHRALVELERAGRLHTLITQNVDGLHHAAGSDPAKVVEVHGTIREVVCLDCGDRAPMQVALDRVAAGEADPPCLACGGILKSATISFGQSLVAEDLERAMAAARATDLLLAVGTTLTVFPAADVVPLAVAQGAPVVIVNGVAHRDGRPRRRAAHRVDQRGAARAGARTCRASR